MTFNDVGVTCGTSGVGLPVASGELVYRFPSIDLIRSHRKDELARLHESHKRLHNPHEYKVGLTHNLWQQKEQMINQATV